MLVSNISQGRQVTSPPYLSHGAKHLLLLLLLQQQRLVYLVLRRHLLQLYLPQSCLPWWQPLEPLSSHLLVGKLLLRQPVRQ